MLTAATSLAVPERSMAAADGLSSAEAGRRLAEFGPNAVAEEKIRPITRVARHFWALVPWMLEATIALQLAVGERLEALIIAALLMLNVGLGLFQENRAGAHPLC
jgi:H+-transporting ATPase